MAEKKPDKKPNDGRSFTPSQFRLSPETLADLDLIAETQAREMGVKFSRTDAVRYSAKREADKIRKKNAD